MRSEDEQPSTYDIYDRVKALLPEMKEPFSVIDFVEKTSINYWSILEALQQLEREGEIEPSTWVLNDKGEE
jgi:hypothetical protein